MKTGPFFMDTILQKIRDFADQSHGEQMRKYSDHRYIVHPERVMKTVEKYSDKIEVLAAALLHDVLEDTPVSGQEIREFLSQLMDDEKAQRTVELVVELTDIYTKDKYSSWNRRKRKEKEADRLSKASADAQTIKYADIIDNCPEIAIEDPDFAERYYSECKTLIRKMDKGNPELRKIAMEIVERKR